MLGIIAIIAIVGVAILLSVFLPDASDGEVKSSFGYRLRKNEDRIENIEKELKMGAKKVILFEICHLCGQTEERVMKFISTFDSTNDLWEFVGFSYSDEEHKNLFFIEATRAIGKEVRK